jgi:RNA polymerase sigma factor (sigma-70 family)
VTSKANSLAQDRLGVLAQERDRWLAFLRQRVGSEAAAEDLLQEGLLRAFRHVGEVRRDEDLLAWFYRVLRHAIVDFYRREAAEKQKNDRFAVEVDAALEADWRSEQAKGTLCTCLRQRLPHLQPRYARLLDAVDLQGLTPAEAATQEGASVNTIHVTLHRARQALRRELVRFCGTCAGEGCLDCGCDSAAPETAASEK